MEYKKKYADVVVVVVVVLDNYDVLFAFGEHFNMLQTSEITVCDRHIESPPIPIPHKAEYKTERTTNKLKIR